MASVYQDPSVASPPRYRAISVWAVLSVVFGAATAAMIYFEWMALPLPLVAIYFGLKALGQIQHAPEDYSGTVLAKVGIGLGTGLGLLFSGWLIFFGGGVPHGYQQLDWADLEPDPSKKNERIPASALALGDPNKNIKVFVRGYILPGRQMVRLKEFSICRTSDQCRFAIKANRPTDLIHIELMGDRTMDYTTHEIAVGGMFRVDPDFPNGTPYLIKADYP